MGGPALGALSADRPIRPGSIGVLGGTFDPIHLGHLNLARAARAGLGLERVLLVPAAVPPHKPAGAVTAGDVRLDLVRAAIAGEPGLEASPIEIEREGPSYTVDTLEALAATERAAGREPDLTLILAADAFADLATGWRAPERILELARIAVGPRPGHAPPDPAWITARLGAGLARFADRVSAFEVPPVAVSATEIRRRVAAGESIADLVPPAVAASIAADHLYRPPMPKDSSPVTEPQPAAATDEAPPRADGLPQRATAAPVDERPALDIARRIVELAEDKKAADIVLLDLTGLTTLADAFVICSGGSERQLGAIADGVIEGMRAEKVRPIGREGTAASHWVLIDFGAVILHVFTPPERDYYSLEKHWSEAKVVLRVQ